MNKVFPAWNDGRSFVPDKRHTFADGGSISDRVFDPMLVRAAQAVVDDPRLGEKLRAMDSERQAEYARQHRDNADRLLKGALDYVTGLPENLPKAIHGTVRRGAQLVDPTGLPGDIADFLGATGAASNLPSSEQIWNEYVPFSQKGDDVYDAGQLVGDIAGTVGMLPGLWRSARNTMRYAKPVGAGAAAAASSEVNKKAEGGSVHPMHDMIMSAVHEYCVGGAT